MPPDALVRLRRRFQTCQRSLEWCIFALGLTTPAVLALLVTVEPALLPATASQPLAAQCRIGRAEVNLHFSCRPSVVGAAVRPQRFPGHDCDSDYYWMVALPLQVQPPPFGGPPYAPPVRSVTLRATAGDTYADAVRLRQRFAPNATVACALDASGAVRSVGGADAQPPPAQQRHSPGEPGPLALLLVHAAWGGLLDRVGAPPRPPPLWLARLGWLPWARCCGPGVPLVTLSCLSAAARVLRCDTMGTLGALSMSTMLAAAAEAAGAVLAEALRAARVRMAAGHSLLPVLAALAYVAAGAGSVAACVWPPLRRELARLGTAARSPRPPHPLGEPLPQPARPVTRALSAALMTGNGGG